MLKGERKIQAPLEFSLSPAVCPSTLAWWLPCAQEGPSVNALQEAAPLGGGLEEVEIPMQGEEKEPYKCITNKGCVPT